MRTLRAALLAVVTVLAIAIGAPVSEAQDPSTATISGHAYTFNTRNVIAGATIRAVEFPDLSTTTAADGSYTLTFPVGSTVTLTIEAAGHGRIHLQSFQLDDEHDGTAVVGANFQTPSDVVYAGLRALVQSYIGRDPFEDGCVVVTTVGMRELQGMPFEEFIRFAPHGVAGATATITPNVAEPIYFNASVVPDPTQLTTSNDGGVLWPNVTPGTYELSATHPTETFTTANIRCEEGWVVNANPVWGLHAIDATTTTSTTTSTTSTSTTSTTVVPTSTTDGSTTSTDAEPLPATESTAPPTTNGSVAGNAATAGATRSGQLARTGDESTRLLRWGGVLLLGGAALVVAARRRAATT